MKLSRRAAFTFVELLTVMTIIGLLARIAIPHYTDFKRRAVAAAIYSDLHTIRLAALHHYADQNQFPADAAPGTVPPELVSQLPNNFSFTHPDYTYDWQVWNSGGEQLLGIAVSSGNAKLIAQLMKMGNPSFIPVSSGSSLTFLLTSN
jgi:prepilin-type N-terminal cleavage/methylation domain-containing protein